MDPKHLHEAFKKTLPFTLPWKISEVIVQNTKNNKTEIHAYLSYEQRTIFCDTTGTPCPIHKTYDKIWQHIDFGEGPCYIHCKVPRIKTTEGFLQTVAVPWARPSSRFSLPFETEIMQKIKNGESFNTVGGFFKEETNRLWTVFNGWVNTAYETNVIDKNISVIGIDEISDQKKNKQITVTIDLKNERVLRVTQGTGKEALQDIRAYLSNKDISVEQIKLVSGPFPSNLQSLFGFLENTKACFPHTEYHIDRLYIIQLLNDAVDQIRKKESYCTKKLTEARALFVKDPILLSEQQKNEVQKLLVQFPSVGQAYELKNEFFALWNQPTSKAASAFLDAWYQEARKTRLSPLKRAAEQIKAHKQSIILFLDLPTDSTAMEKIHEKIIAATKRTKGLKNPENVSNMIIFCCGKLTFPYT